MTYEMIQSYRVYFLVYARKIAVKKNKTKNRNIYVISLII